MRRREIDRALAMAAEFNLDPIVVGAAEATDRIAELQKAKARVISQPEFSGRPRRRRAARAAVAAVDAVAAAPRRRLHSSRRSATRRRFRRRSRKRTCRSRSRQAALPAAADFVRNAGRTVKEGGLAADAALKALTIDAARIAGAADRSARSKKARSPTSSSPQGDLFDGGTVRHVFIDGRPVDLTPPAPATGRAGRGGGERN